MWHVWMYNESQLQSQSFSQFMSPLLWGLGGKRSPHSCVFPSCLLQDPSSLHAAFQDQERVEEREERLPYPGNDAPAIGKWAVLSWQALHFNPTRFGNPLPHSTPFSSTAQFPNSTVDSLANIFLTFTTQLQPQGYSLRSNCWCHILSWWVTLAAFQAAASGFGKCYTSFAHRIL